MTTIQEKNNKIYETVGKLPGSVERELISLMKNSPSFAEEISELRIRVWGVCSIVAGGRSYPLFATVSGEEMSLLVKRLCGDALYAHRDGIGKGYISISGGIRVGIVGTARYEDGRIVGVGDISSLVFRFPTGRCDFADELCAEWRRLGCGSMLIVSAPSGGKTTALRAMARLLGRGRDALRIAVVDERCEFAPEDYTDCSVDIISGYKRSDGIDIAVRTMSPELIMTDEIGTEEDSRALSLASGVGVSVIATAHGTSAKDVMGRKFIARLIESGMFNTVCRLTRQNGSFGFDIESVL